jgi:hypothetical protein
LKNIVQPALVLVGLRSLAFSPPKNRIGFANRLTQNIAS